MAEGGVLSGILGGEDERAEAEGLERADAEAVAFAAAIAAEEARRDPRVARATEAFLEEQTRLLRAQREEVVEQRQLRLSHLISQSREGRLRRFGQRIRNGMQVVGLVIATAIGLGLTGMVWEAASSRSVVVDAFKAPSTLAPRGLTGDVVAARVLDGLEKLREATRASGKLLDSRGAWASDVKIEVPETGVSIGEIDRLLHERLGHDLHIDGDLVQSDSGGLALTVRGDHVPARTFSGGAGDLDSLATQAAEYIYGRSQAYPFATYLNDAGRFKDVLDFMPGAFGRAASDAERAELANGWGIAYNGLNMPREAIAKFRMGMSLTPKLSPTWWKLWGNLIGSASPLGEEAAWRESRAFLDAYDAAPARRRPDVRLLGNAAAVVWDLPLVLQGSLDDAAHNSGAGAQSIIEGPSIADDYALMHDPVHAERYMAASDPNDPATKAEVLLIPAYAALDRGDGQAAVPLLEAFWKMWLGDPNMQFTYADVACLLGGAYGLAGRMAEAEAVFKRVGPFSRCAAWHGDALEHAGDLAGAERVWAENLKIAPDLPMVYLHRGASELKRGDLRAAEADFSAAHAKAPHFAEPLKAWGDLLVREGQRKAAVAKYDEALKYAPAWVELRQARDSAARTG